MLVHRTPLLQIASQFISNTESFKQYHSRIPIFSYFHSPIKYSFVYLMEPQSHRITSQFQRQNRPRFQSMLKSSCSFILLSPHGTGKSNLISSLLINIPHIILNCTYLQNQSLFNILAIELRKAIKTKRPPRQFNNFESLIMYVNEMWDFPQDGEFNEIKDNGGLVCVFENCEELRLKEKTLRNLFEIGERKLRFRVMFVFVGVCLPSLEVALSRAMSFVTVVMPRPDMQFMIEISMQHLDRTYREKYTRWVQSLKKHKKPPASSNPTTQKSSTTTKVSFDDFPSVCKALIQIVLEAVRYITTDLDEIKRYMELMFERLQSALEQGDYTRVYGALMGSYFKDCLSKKVEYGPLEESEIEVIQTRAVNLDDGDYDYKFNFYPELMATAMFMAENGTENDDERRFKDTKKIKKNKQLKRLQKRSKQNMFRVQAIADSLQSQIRNKDKSMYFQGHSLDYYSCYEHLVQENRMRYVGESSGAHGLGKMEATRVNENQVRLWLKKNGLEFGQYY